MIHTFAALNSKGGVGKTTFLANLGGLLADMGARTLLVEADPQPSLTKYFGLAYEAPEGFGRGGHPGSSHLRLHLAHLGAESGLGALQ